ncbi:MAG TPA: thioredoxin [Planctomycetaceae bacterium]|nr:thioredoxin [Planctomycetaceae bacterium]
MQSNDAALYFARPYHRLSSFAIYLAIGWITAVAPTTALADTPQEKTAPANDQSEAAAALQPLVQAINDAAQILATVELTSRSMINGQVVASDVAVYQIASKKPNLYSIQLKGGDQLMQVVSDGKIANVILGGTAYYQIPAQTSLQPLVTESPIPMGPYPEPVMALTLAGADVARTFLTEMQSLELVKAEAVEDVPSVHVRGVQADGVSWSLWAGTQPGKVKPLRLKIDLTKVVVGDNEDGLPDGFAYELDMRFTQWRADGELDPSIFVFKPSPDVKKFDTLEDLIASMEAKESRHPLTGLEAPDFKTSLLDGNAFQLSKLRGKVVVLDFWATWCGPCVQAMPVVNEVAQSMADSGVVVYAVNVGEQADEINDFLKKVKITVPIVLDPENKIAGAYQTEAIPQTILIGKDGRIEVVHIGFDGLDKFRQQLTDQLKTLVDGGKLADAP